MKFVPVCLMICLSMALFTSPALANDNSQPQQKAEDAVDPRVLAEAKILDEVTQYRRNYEEMAKAYTNMYVEILSRANPGKEGLIQQIVEKNFQSANAKVADDLAEKRTILVAQTYSYDEIRAMVDFFSSPVGREITSKTSLVEKKYFDSAEHVAMADLSGPIKNVFQEAQKDGLSIPENIAMGDKK